MRLQETWELGLEPEKMIVLGAGFSRESFKQPILDSGVGILQTSIWAFPQWCLTLQGVSEDRWLTPLARQEVLRTLMMKTRVMSALPHLNRLRRQKNFLNRLDRALQRGRMSFAHAEEEEVYENYLKQSLSENLLRKELKQLTQGYESWLLNEGFWDLPCLLRALIQQLTEKGWPKHRMPYPKAIHYFNTQKIESLERLFWDRIKYFVPVYEKTLLKSMNQNFSSPLMFWERWHTLDSAADALADRVSLQTGQDVICFPDNPQLVQTLQRAFNDRGYFFLDPDRWTSASAQESFKSLFLSFEVVVSHFERERVLAWLRAFDPHEWQVHGGVWQTQMYHLGIVSGLSSYDVPALKQVYQRLFNLNQRWSGRKTLMELASLHQSEPQVEQSEWRILVQKFWEDWQQDLNRIDPAQKKVSLRFWWECFHQRFRQWPGIRPPLVPEEGIESFFLDQAPLRSYERIWILGLSSYWLEGIGTGTYWWSEREREILSSEFCVRSCLQVRQERLELLKAWIQSAASQVIWIDTQYHFDGTESESLLATFQELQRMMNVSFPQAPEQKGAHPRWVPSYRTIPPVQPQMVRLPAEKTQISATLLDRWSRCSFQALAYHRWKLKDLKEPSFDLWPEVRGQLLHEAVRCLMKAQQSDGTWLCLPSEALDQAWRKTPPWGWIAVDRVQQYVRRQILKLLEVFCEKERQQVQKQGKRFPPVLLDEQSLKYETSEWTWMGQPDRVDQHPEGLWVIDYKTSSDLPHGQQIVQDGYRLQLPFYAVLLEKVLQKPVIGAQYIELTRRGNRNRGIFFKRWNRKTPGGMTTLRAHSKSLFQQEPSEVWLKLEQDLKLATLSYQSGHFVACPSLSVSEKECQRCFLGVLCGLQRRRQQPESSQQEDTRVIS